MKIFGVSKVTGEETRKRNRKCSGKKEFRASLNLCLIIRSRNTLCRAHVSTRELWYLSGGSDKFLFGKSSTRRSVKNSGRSCLFRARTRWRRERARVFPKDRRELKCAPPDGRFNCWREWKQRASGSSQPASLARSGTRERVPTP